MDIDLLALVTETARRGRKTTVGMLTGQKPAPKDERSLGGRRVGDLALFNPVIDSKQRGWDLVALKVEDVTAADDVKSRGVTIQTGRPSRTTYFVKGRRLDLNVDGLDHTSIRIRRAEGRTTAHASAPSSA